MEWKDIDQLFQKAKHQSEHEWLEEEEDDSSQDGSGFSDDEEENDEQKLEARDELASEQVLHEKERALLQAMKYFKKKQAGTASGASNAATLQNTNLKPIPKPLPKPPAPDVEEKNRQSTEGKPESLYSKTQDDKDTAWIRAHYLKHRAPVAGQPAARASDATLSCPCCFTVMCYDCQRHETYRNQYVAMYLCFVSTHLLAGFGLCSLPTATHQRIRCCAPSLDPVSSSRSPATIAIRRSVCLMRMRSTTSSPC